MVRRAGLVLFVLSVAGLSVSASMARSNLLIVSLYTVGVIIGGTFFILSKDS